MIIYDNYRNLLRERGISEFKMRHDLNISTNISRKFVDGGHVSTATLDKMCNYFDCQPADLISWMPDDERIEYKLKKIEQLRKEADRIEYELELYKINHNILD